MKIDSGPRPIYGMEILKTRLDETIKRKSGAMRCRSIEVTSEKRYQTIIVAGNRRFVQSVVDQHGWWL